VYSVLADAVLVVHLLCILWIVFGAVFTRRRPLLRWVHIASVVWGVLIELLPWTCPLTWAENWLKAKAGLAPYQGGFLLNYLDALVYPNIPLVYLPVWVSPSSLFNLGIYAFRLRRRALVGW